MRLSIRGGKAKNMWPGEWPFRGSLEGTAGPGDPPAPGLLGPSGTARPGPRPWGKQFCHPQQGIGSGGKLRLQQVSGHSAVAQLDPTGHSLDPTVDLLYALAHPLAEPIHRVTGSAPIGALAPGHVGGDAQRRIVLGHQVIGGEGHEHFHLMHRRPAHRQPPIIDYPYANEAMYSVQTVR